MRPTLHPLATIACLLPFFTSALLAQEPVTPASEPKPEATEAAPPTARAPRGPGRTGRQRQRTVAVFASHVHPVSTPEIEGGVILLRGDRIVAVGKEGEVEIPENAETVRFDGAHVYPGFIDASTDAFLDDGARQDASADAATSAGAAFGNRFDREDRLIESGITTIYTQNRRGNPWSGVGAVLRPKKGGAAAFPDKSEAGVGLQVAAGPTGTHALDRQRAIEGALGAFSGLDDYRKKLDEHKKAVEKYSKDFTDYLAWHEKKNGKSEGDKKPEGDKPAAATGEATSPPADAGAGARGARGNRRGAGQPQGPGGGGPGGEPKPEQPKPEEQKPQEPKPGEPTPPKPQEPKPQEPKPDQPKPQEPKPEEPKPDQPKPDQPKPGTPEKQEPKPQGDAKPAEPKPEAKPAETKAADSKSAEAKADDKAPERPKYPKPPDRDPARDMLLKVLDGDLPLRITVRRPDEMRAAIAVAREKKLPSILFEEALGAAAVAKELAEAAVPCVLTGLFPAALPEGYEKLAPQTAPKALHDAGAAFAIATGSGRSARALPMMAAAAVGEGLPALAALRAVTLSPAEILGIQKDVGSLQQGKLADLVVCDRPWLQSDCRVLAVYSSGQLEHERREPQQEPK